MALLSFIVTSFRIRPSWLVFFFFTEYNFLSNIQEMCLWNICQWFGIRREDTYSSGHFVLSNMALTYNTEASLFGICHFFRTFNFSYHLLFLFYFKFKEKAYFFKWCISQILFSCCVIRRKRKISDSVLWQKPLHPQKNKKQRDNKKNATKPSITQRLRTDLGRSVEVTTTTRLVWLNRNSTRTQPSN